MGEIGRAAAKGSRGRLGIGVDFGTTNSTIACFDGERHRLLKLDPGTGAVVMPTALYLDRALKPTVGQPAIERYLNDNQDRSVEPSREVVGVIEVTVSETEQTRGLPQDDGAIIDTYLVHAMTDQELPGRLFRSTKRWLGEASIEGVRVFGREVRIVALITPVLRVIAERIQRDAGAADAGPIHVGRPVRYEGRGDDSNATGAGRMHEALVHAELPGAKLQPEPVAAALSYLHAHPAGVGGPVLAFDFGGGTLDLSVVRAGAASHQVLASHGLRIGGDHVDQLVYRSHVFPELGEGVLYDRPIGPTVRRVRFAFERFGERLLNWPLAYQLNDKRTLDVIEQAMATDGASCERLERLRELIEGNHSYRVFRAIERAKCELSEQPGARIVVDELDLDVPIERSELDALLAPMLDDVRRALSEVVERAGLSDDDIAAVVRTGGSAQIPAVGALLEERFPGRVTSHDTFTSIAAGLAVASFAEG